MIEHTHTITRLSGQKFIIAVGSEPTRPLDIPFTPGRVLDSDGLLQLPTIPRSMTVVGAGIIGCEYGSIFATLGVEVTLVDQRRTLIEFADREIIEALTFYMRKENMTLRSGKRWRRSLSTIGIVSSRLASGKRIISETLLFAIGRQGATAGLNLDAVGLETDERGRLKVNNNYQTAVDHIYAAGDVIGFPSLASTSMEQGRLAACHRSAYLRRRFLNSRPLASTPFRNFYGGRDGRRADAGTCPL